MKQKLPYLVIILVYIAFVIIDRAGGSYEPSHLILFPLAALAYFLPVLFAVHIIVSLFARPWREESLNWIIFSIDIIIAGALATIEVL